MTDHDLETPTISQDEIVAKAAHPSAPALPEPDLPRRPIPRRYRLKGLGRLGEEIVEIFCKMRGKLGRKNAGVVDDDSDTDGPTIIYKTPYPVDKDGNIVLHPPLFRTPGIIRDDSDDEVEEATRRAEIRKGKQPVQHVSDEEDRGASGEEVIDIDNAVVQALGPVTQPLARMPAAAPVPEISEPNSSTVANDRALMPPPPIPKKRKRPTANEDAVTDDNDNQDDNGNQGQPTTKKRASQISCKSCCKSGGGMGADTCNLEKLGKRVYLECSNCAEHRLKNPNHVCKVLRTTQKPWRKYAANAPTRYPILACDECEDAGRAMSCDADTILGYSCSHCNEKDGCHVKGEIMEPRFTGRLVVRPWFRHQCDVCTSIDGQRSESQEGCSWLLDRTTWDQPCSRSLELNLTCVDNGHLIAHPSEMSLPQSWAVDLEPLKQGFLVVTGSTPWRKHCKRCIADEHVCQIDAGAAQYACERCTQLGIDCVSIDNVKFQIFNLARIGMGTYQPFLPCDQCMETGHNCDHQRPCDSCVHTGKRSLCDDWAPSTKKGVNCINGRLNPPPGPLYYLAMGYGPAGVSEAKTGSSPLDWVGPLADISAMISEKHIPEPYGEIAVKLRSDVMPLGPPPTSHWEDSYLVRRMPSHISARHIKAAIKETSNGIQRPNKHQDYIKSIAEAHNKIQGIQEFGNKKGGGEKDSSLGRGDDGPAVRPPSMSSLYGNAGPVPNGFDTTSAMPSIFEESFWIPGSDMSNELSLNNMVYDTWLNGGPWKSSPDAPASVPAPEKDVVMTGTVPTDPTEAAAQVVRPAPQPVLTSGFANPAALHANSQESHALPSHTLFGFVQGQLPRIPPPLSNVFATIPEHISFPTTHPVLPCGNMIKEGPNTEGVCTRPVPQESICADRRHSASDATPICDVCLLDSNDAIAKTNFLTVEDILKCRAYLCTDCARNVSTDTSALNRLRHAGVNIVRGLPVRDPHISGVTSLPNGPIDFRGNALPVTGCSCGTKLLQQRLCGPHREELLVSFLFGASEMQTWREEMFGRPVCPGCILTKLPEEANLSADADNKLGSMGPKAWACMVCQEWVINQDIGPLVLPGYQWWFRSYPQSWANSYPVVELDSPKIPAKSCRHLEE